MSEKFDLERRAAQLHPGEPYLLTRDNVRAKAMQLAHEAADARAEEIALKLRARAHRCDPEDQGHPWEAEAFFEAEYIARSTISKPEPPKPAWTVRRDEHGYAVALERNGWSELLISPGASRNESEGGAEKVCALLNASEQRSAPSPKIREAVLEEALRKIADLHEVPYPEPASKVDPLSQYRQAGWDACRDIAQKALG